MVSVSVGISNQNIGKRLSLMYRSQGTSKIAMYKCILSNMQKVWLVDTPGFDDIHGSDTEILAEVANWLAKSYE